MATSPAWLLSFRETCATRSRLSRTVKPSSSTIRLDGRVLSEFRHAVDRVRTSGWQVQVWLEGDPRALSVLLMEERIRTATRLVLQLATEITSSGKEFLGLGLLKEAMQKLDRLL